MKKNSQTGFITPFLIIIASILVIGTGVYLYIENLNHQKFLESLSTTTSQNNQVPPTTKSSSSNTSSSGSVPIVPPTSVNQQNSGWKTFAVTFELLNYSFKYPTDSKILTGRSGGDALVEDAISGKSQVDIAPFMASYPLDQIAKQFGSDSDYASPSITDFVTSSGLKGKEIVGKGGVWTIVIDSGKKYFGQSIMLAVTSDAEQPNGSSDKTALKPLGEEIAKTLGV